MRIRYFSKEHNVMNYFSKGKYQLPSVEFNWNQIDRSVEIYNNVFENDIVEVEYEYYSSGDQIQHFLGIVEWTGTCFLIKHIESWEKQQNLLVLLIFNVQGTLI